MKRVVGLANRRDGARLSCRARFDTVAHPRIERGHATMHAMTRQSQITITTFAARLGVHPVTVRRRAKADPTFPQPRRLPSGALMFDEEDAARAIAAAQEGRAV